ncbi:MAG: TRAP transporter substrate-binding protein DctP [Treponema sp.]|nr:TRAP transporter substrate-binding protein DctP [Treponema sp.]
MKKCLILFTLAFFFLSLGVVFAQRGSARSDVINVRIASSLPRNSDWGRALERLASDWARVTNNQLRAVVSHDGREGNETRMLSSLSSDAIQVAVLTSAGISEICPEVMCLSVPFFIRNNTELDLVLKEVQPVLESHVRNDFVVIAWSKGGWVYLFSKERVLTPDDLRRQKLGTSPGLNDMNTTFRTMGFTLVETDLSTIGTRLASNMLNAIYMIPAAIAPMQLHRSLNHMLELPIAPIMGAIVMNRVTWNKFSQAYQQEIIRATRQIASEFDASMARTEASAISAMNRDGLSVNKPSQAQQENWFTDIQRATPSLVGSVFNRDLYSRISEILERSRGRR